MTEDEPRQDPGLPEDARLRSLDRRLKQAQAQESARTGTKSEARTRDDAVGMRVLGELIGPPFGGALFGLVLDGWLGTGHWLLLVLLFVGFGIGIRKVVQISKTQPGGDPGADETGR